MMGIRQWLIATAAAASLAFLGLFSYDHVKTTVISADFGGSIGDYIENYAKIRHTTGPVRIEDVCISACTMVLGLIPADRVCAEPNAKFGFHSAWQLGPFGPVFSREGTRLVWNIYPDAVQAELIKRGWDGEGDKPHPELLYVPATRFVKECKDG